MRAPFAHEAVVVLPVDADEAAVGAAITVALCGHWEHPPPCPLAPHHTAAHRDGDRVRVRTLFAVEPAREGEVRALIEGALAAWPVRRSGRAEIEEGERAHAQRLVRSP